MPTSVAGHQRGLTEEPACSGWRVPSLLRLRPADDAGLLTGRPVSPPAPSSPSPPQGHREGSQPKPDLFTPLCSALQLFPLTGYCGLCTLLPAPLPPGQQFKMTCPSAHASGPPFMQFPQMELLSFPFHPLVHYHCLAKKPGQLLPSIRQGGKSVLLPHYLGSHLSSATCCGISGKLLNLSVSRSPHVRHGRMTAPMGCWEDEVR